MPKTKPENAKKAAKRRVTFSVEAPGAEKVNLMGDFNDWDPEKHFMKNDGAGNWNKTVVLDPGEYEYKFLIDGQWHEDPQNYALCPNCFGSMNNILKVSSP